ncbi:MAG: aspartate-semialdehyde dehydrogenase [Chlamydiia bacterium]
MGKINVGILGATGAIGELYSGLLKNHPHFQLRFLAASERSFGESFEGISVSSVRDFDLAKNLGVKVLFSGLDTTTALEIEPLWAKEFLVISSSSAFRNSEQLILPEINGAQVIGKRHGIFSKSNCTLHPIILPLQWLKDFGIKHVTITTFQAVSGAGKKGLGAMEILDNVIPYIHDEEKKIDEELHLLMREKIPLDITCCRVPVFDGHLVSLVIEFAKSVSVESIRQRFQKSSVFHLFEQQDRPQPRLDRMVGEGMTVSVGRIRRGEGNRIQMVTLSHNRIRGAAGTGLKIAEIAYGITQPGF